MVAAISGSGLGLFGSSLSALGGAGIGRGGDRVFVNAATGNLVVQSQDETLSALGLDLALVRTYNSQGLLNDDNGDNWRLGIHERVYGLTGTLNSAGSTVLKVFGDGREVLYQYNVAQSRYVSTEGDGAHDTLTNSGGTWTWTDGSSRSTEAYDASGRLTQSRDADGNTSVYSYTNNLLTQITNAGQTIYLDYSGNNLTQIRVVSNGQTQTLTRYGYDASNRLTEVKVDLTPQDNSVADNRVYVTTYTYDGTSRRIASITQTDGSSSTFAYNLLDGEYRVTSYTDAEGRLTTLAYSQVSAGGAGSTSLPANAGALSTSETQTNSTNHTLNSGALSTTDTQTTNTSYSLSSGALTPGSGGWSSAALLESSGTQAENPKIRFDANGNGMAIWREAGNLYARRYTQSNDTWSAALALDSRTETVYAPVLAVQADGDAIVAWAQSNGTANSLYTRIYDAGTNTWAAAQLLESSSQPVDTTTGSVAVSMMNGYATAAWLQSDGTRNNVYLATFSGTSWGSPVLVESSTNAVSQPTVMIDDTGEVVVAWRQMDGAASNLYYNWASPGGEWHGAVLLEDLSAAASDPTYMVDGNSNESAIWVQGNDVRVFRYTASTSVDSWLTLDTRDETPYAPALAVDPGGDAIAAWVQSNGTANSIYASRYSISTGTWSTPQLVENSSQPAATASGSVVVAISGSYATVAWLQNDGTRDNLYSAVYSGGSWGAATLIESSNNAAAQPSVAIDGTGRVTVLWQQSDGTVNSIYQSRYSGAGSGPYYVVPAAATWQSIANTLYGVNSAAAGSALQTALGSPALTTGAQLSNLPATLTVTTTATVTVPPYFTIPAGASWQSIANTLYGVNSAAAGSALQSALGNPPLTAGNRLTSLPSTLTVTTTTTVTVPAYYTVQAADTWASITQTIYGTSNAAAVSALQSALGNPTLSVGLHLTVPPTLTYGGGSSSAVYLQTDVTDALLRVTRYTQDANGRLTSVLSPTVNGVRLQTRYGYDADGNVISVIEDPNGLNRVTSMSYDANGNLLTTRDSLGNTVTRTYNGNNQLLTETQYLTPDPDGAGVAQPSSPQTTRYVYESDAGKGHQLRFVVSAQGRVTEHRYTNEGLRSTTLKYLGALYAAAPMAEADLINWAATQTLTQLERTEYAYDFRGNLSTLTTYSTTNASGAGTGAASIVQFVYDQRGQLLQTIEARGSATTPNPAVANLQYATTYTYDGLGRVLSTTQWSSSDAATGLTTTLNAYDDANRRTATTFANGLLTTRTYDRTGGLIKVENGTSGTSAQFGTTKYAYDAGGHLRIVTDPTGVRQFFFYDAAGRRSAQVDGDGTLTEYIYDDASELIKTVRYAAAVDAATLASLVDAQERPTAVALAKVRTTASGLPAEDRITRNVYNSAGQLIYTIDEVGALTQRFYDGAGRITDEVRYAQPVTIARSVDQLREGDFTITSSSADRRTRYFYDADGKLLGTLDAAGYLLEYKYNPAGYLFQQIAYATQTNAGYWQAGTLDQLRPASDNETAVTPEQDIVSYFFYDGQGRRVGVLDAEGYLTETLYDLAGRTSQVVRYDRRLTYTAGTSTFQTLKQAAAGASSHTSGYQYDGAGRLTQETDYRGVVTIYAYDKIGQLVGTTRAAGTAEARTTETRYDFLGRVLQELTAEGRAKITAGMTQSQIDDIWNRYSITYAYDISGRKISATTRPSDTEVNTTYYYYDADNRLRFAVNALGEVEENRYNTFGELTDTITYTNRLASVTGLSGGLLTSALTAALSPAANPARDAQTTYRYTLSGRVLSKRAASTTNVAQDALTTYTYNAFGESDTRTDAIDASSSLLTSYIYEKRGLLKEVHRDAGFIDASAVRQYDAFGRLTKVTDARGNTSQVKYDRLGRQIEMLDALSGSRLTTYDAFSRTLTTRDALNNTSSYTYDDVNRRMTVTTPEGIAVNTQFTVHGQILSVTAAGNTVTYAYDLNGSLTSTSDNLGALETRRYDRGGRLDEQVDALGEMTKFTYDAADRVLTRTEDFGAGRLQLQTVYAYDGQGRVMRVTEPSGRITDTTYYRDGRVEQISVDPTGLNLRTRYTYDRTGHVITTTEGLGSTTPRVTEYRYDALGRRTHEIVDPGSGTNVATGLAYLNLTTRYSYDKSGNLTRSIDANGNSTWYVYDADNRRSHTINALGEVTQATYDAEDRVISTRRYATALSAATMTSLVSLNVVTTANFSVASSGTDRFDQSIYDRDGRERYSIDAAGAVTERTFDANGHVTRSRTYASVIAAGTYTTAATVTTALTNAGNNTNTIGADDRVEWAAYDLRGRKIYLVDGTGAVVRFSYDSAGNVVTSVAYAQLRSTSLATDLASLDGWAATAAVANNLDNRTTRYWYDGKDREVFKFDAEGYLHETRYDDANRRSSTILYGNKPTIAASATTQQVRQNSVVTSFDASRDRVSTKERDAAGRVIRIFDALTSAAASTYEEYGYDAVGNRITTIDPRGVELADRNTSWAQTERVRLGFGANATSLTPAQRTQLRTLYTTTRTFDAAGRELTSTDPLGAITRKTYDGAGNLIKLVDARGNAGYFYYDAAGRVRYQIDPLSYVTERRYDALGDVRDELTYATALAFTYSETSTLSQIQAGIVLDGARDRRMSKTYDGQGSVSTITYQGATTYTEEYLYNAFGEKRQFKDKNNARFDYYYNARGDLRREVAPEVEVVTAVLPNVTSQLLRLETHYEYDAFGAKTLKREAAGTGLQRDTRYYYDNAGREKRVELPSFSVYSRASNSSTGTTPTVQKQYDAAGNLVLEIAPDGGRTVNYYDTRNLLIASVDADNALREYQYDSVGNVLAERTYDSRLTGVQVPQTRPTAANPNDYRELTYLYDANNRRIQTQTRVETLFSSYLWLSGQGGYYTAPVKTNAGYDANGNVIWTVDGNNNVTYQFYDAKGNRILQVDAAGYVTRWQHNAQGQLERETKYAGQLSDVFRQTLNASTTVQTILNAVPVGDDRITEFDYDQHGRIKTERKMAVSYATVRASDGLLQEQQGNLQTTYEYDGNNHLTAQIQPGQQGRIDYTYDALGRKTSQLNPQFQGFNGRGQALLTLREQTVWSYDALGNTAVETKLAQAPADNRESRFQYDAAGNMRTQRDAQGALFSYDYDVKANVLRTSRQVTDINSVTHVYGTHHAYDVLDRETSRQDTEDEGAPTQVLRETRETRYNAHGDIEAKGVSGQYQERYIYDRLGRLFWTNSDNGTPRLHVYDANGNAALRIHAIDKDLTTVQTPSGPRPVIGPSDAPLFLPTDIQLTVSVYDRRNQLVEVIEPPMTFGDLLAGSPTLNQSGGLSPEVLRELAQYSPPNTGVFSPPTSLPPPARQSSEILITSTGSQTSESYATPRPGSSNTPTPQSIPELTAGTTTTPVSTVVDPTTPGPEISPDQLTKKVTQRETRTSTQTTIVVNGNYSVDRTFTTTTDLITSVTTFTRSAVPVPGMNESLATQWTLQTTEVVTTNRTVSSIVDHITRTKVDSVVVTPVGSSASYPGSLSVVPAVNASITGVYRGQPGSGFPPAFWDNWVTVTVPPIDAFGSDPVTVTVFWGNNTSVTKAASPNTQVGFFEKNGIMTVPQRVEIRKGGRLLASQTVSINGTATAAIGPFVSIKAQDPTATSVSLNIGAGAFVSSTPEVFVNALGGKEYIFQVPTNVNLSSQYEYVVQAGSTVLNAVRGVLGTSHNNRYSITTSSETRQRTDPGVDGINVYSHTATDTAEPQHSEYLRWLSLTVSQGLVHDNIIHRRQTYNAFGEIATQTDGRLNRTDFVYNDLGQLTARIQPTTKVYPQSSAAAYDWRPTTRYYYDELGQLVGTQDANSDQLAAGQKYFSTRVVVAGRVEKEFDPLGYSKRYVYDRLGNKRQEFDELSQETEYLYSLSGGLTRVNRYGATGTLHSYDTYAYDQAGNRISHTNALNDTERYLFDGQNRVVRHTSFAGRTTQYQYTYQSTIGGIGGYEKQTITTGTVGTDTLIDRHDYFGRIRYHQDLGGHEFTYLYNTAGWLKEQHGTTAASGRYPQNITYNYFHNGLLESISDSGIDSYARFQYDKEGNRTIEAYSQVPIATGTQTQFPYQIATAQYDELNRLKRVYQDGKFDMTYTYDAVGNRRSVEGTYTDLLTNTTKTKTYFYTYDKLNRFVITMGDRDAGGNIVRGDEGYEIEYDAAGRRSSARSDHLDKQGVVRPKRETYTYDPTGTVRDVYIYNGAGILEAHTARQNNALGQQRYYYEYDGVGALKTSMYYEYDQDGLTRVEENRTVNNSRERTTYNYVGNGILSTVESKLVNEYGSPISGSATVTLNYAYEKWDDYKNSTVTITGIASEVRGWRPGESRYKYDSNGHIKEVYDSQAFRTIQYVNNHNGQVLKRSQIDRELSGSDKPPVIRQFYVLNDVSIGDVGTDNVPSRVDYAQVLASREKNGKKVFARIGDRVFPVTSADFDQNYQPIGPDYPAHAPQSHVVSAGETLRSIAFVLWGDADMWYVLADANGLSGDDQLVAGTRLTIPNVVTNIHNNSGTFRPFDPEAVMGDTSPTLPDPPPPPPPKRGGCGVLGMILIIVVAIVVTIYTAGVAAGGTSAALAGGTTTAATSTWAAGMAAFSGGLASSTAAIGAAAIGGAVGSAVSQGVAIAAGMQNGFDWKGVALGAIGGGVTAGLGIVGNGALGATVKSLVRGNSYALAAINGATSNALTQGISVATGLQRSFSWRNVAISSLAAPVAHGFGEAASALAPGVGDFGARVASGVGGSLVRRAFGSGEDSASILADSFGNALGSSIVDGMTPRSASAQARDRTVDELQEVAVTARYVGPGAEERNARLDNNPINAIRAGSSVSPDEISAATNASGPGGPEEVIVEAQRLSRPQELLYDRLITPRYLGGGSKNEYEAIAIVDTARRYDIRYENTASIENDRVAINFGLAMIGGGAAGAFGAALFPTFLASTGSVLQAGVASGVISDVAFQGYQNGLFAGSGGDYGRSGIDGTELALSAGLGALPGLPMAVRGWADDLRGLGVPDWNIRLSRPGTLYSNGIGLELERIGGSDLFRNQLPGSLAAELRAAADAGVRPIRIGDPAFDQVVNQGTVKYVVTEGNELLIAPYSVGQTEVSHAVLSQGRPVLAAGQADIAGASGEYIGLGITPHSGHYLNGASAAQSALSLSRARDAFARSGIMFPN
jgi:YD repeat-containing protein